MSELSMKPADTLARDRRIDCICDEFEAAWLAGQDPQLQDYLGRVAEEDRAALALELTVLNNHYRQRHGKGVDVTAPNETPKNSAPGSQAAGSLVAAEIVSIGAYEVLQE